MEFEGTVYKIMPVTKGTSARGEWQRQDVVFEMNEGSFTRKICVTFFNKPDDVARLREGATYTVSVNIESREYNGRWYTDIRAWRIQPKQEPAPAPMPDMLPRWTTCRSKFRTGRRNRAVPRTSGMACTQRTPETEFRFRGSYFSGTQRQGPQPADRNKNLPHKHRRGSSAGTRRKESRPENRQEPDARGTCIRFLSYISVRTTSRAQRPEPQRSNRREPALHRESRR